MTFRLPLLLFALAVGAPASAQDYYDPITKARREIASLEAEKAEVQKLIEDVAAEIRNDKKGFYRRHEADCEVTVRRPDGSFDYIYKPSREWFAKRKRLKEAIAEKTEDLRVKLVSAERTLQDRIEDLERRKSYWDTSLARLEKIGEDLGALRDEWEAARWNSIREGLSDLLPAMEPAFSLMETPEGAAATGKLPKEASERLKTSVSAAKKLFNGLKELREGMKAADRQEELKKIVDGINDCHSAMLEVFKLLDPKDKKIFEVLDGSVGAMFNAVKAAAIWNEKGLSSPEASREAGEQIRSAIKGLGEFYPPLKVAEKIERAGEMGLEVIISQRALGSISWAVDEVNAPNLERARERVKALSDEIETCTRKQKEYRNDLQELPR